MTVRLVTTIQRWEGLSTDVKPTGDIREGSRFLETDTGILSVYQNDNWTRDWSVPVSTRDYIDTSADNRRLIEALTLKIDTLISLKIEEA